MEIIPSNSNRSTDPHPDILQTQILKCTESDKLPYRVERGRVARFPGPNPGNFDHHSSESSQLRVMIIKDSSPVLAHFLSLQLLAAG